MHHLLDHAVRFDPSTGTADGAVWTERRLSDLRGCFADPDAYEAALLAGDPVVYTVASFAPADGDGQLHYGLGTLMPGRVGREFFLTKGHLHEWRPAAELYIGLRGEGCMLLEDERTGEARMLPLAENTTVYVPGRTAHRTINTGDEPLVYLGVYPSAAGHDYGFVRDRNFRHVVAAGPDGPVLVERTAYRPRGSANDEVRSSNGS